MEIEKLKSQEWFDGNWKIGKWELKLEIEIANWKTVSPQTARFPGYSWMNINRICIINLTRGKFIPSNRMCINRIGALTWSEIQNILQDVY